LRSGSLILGVDPGSRITGYGLIASEANRLVYVDSGCVRLPATPLPERLAQIFQAISQLVTQYQPQVMAVEQVFMAQNVGAALKLGQARGAAISAGIHGQLAVSEYSARQVKQAVVGKGNADKQQVQHMVRYLLQLKTTPQVDAADALAVAICHIHTQQSMNRLFNAHSSNTRFNN
jgi:crossover junction endodeoxyribonuclease RuvC